ncbi:hypothetical protein C8R43DRAFT_1114853 [Mycena crocata]|nr:hypothetical protein C8R43DRAFT_1114853 [Mycena crocata]
MPARPAANRDRLIDVRTGFTRAVDLLELLSDNFNPPFLTAISSTARSLLNSVEMVKQNRSDCAQLMEQIYELLYRVVFVYIKSETGPDLPPSTMNHLGKFTETLHKVHTFVEAQKGASKIRQFLRQGERSALLKDCKANLQETWEILKVQDIDLIKTAGDLQKYADKQHKEVPEMIAGLSGTNSDRNSSMTTIYSTKSYSSSNSISMLPSEPKIFYGRESELSDILRLFEQGTPRVAILGTGGIGKTTLARAVLHHPQMTMHYAHHRFFVDCNSSSTRVELAAQIGSHLGLRPGKDLTRPVVHYFSTNPASVLILDNLETLWEPMESRRDTEEFLSLLTEGCQKGRKGKKRRP